MNKTTLILLTTITILTGCSTTETVKTEKPPKHMGRVEFVQYDTTKRAMTPAVDVYDSQPTRKYKVIATITCEGAYHEEIVMTKAIIFKARELGAEAIVRLDQSNAQTGSGSMYGFHKGGRSLFRCNAIVFEKE